MNRRVLIPAVVIAGIAIAFSSIEDEPADSPVPPSAAKPVPPSAAKPVPNACVKISNVLGEALVEAQSEGDGMKFVRGQAIKSPNHANVYFIATEFSATGVDNQVAVFMSNKLDGNGAVKAVDGTAKEFTHWVDADFEDVADPTVDKVRGCLS